MPVLQTVSVKQKNPQNSIIKALKYVLILENQLLQVRLMEKLLQQQTGPDYGQRVHEFYDPKWSS